MRRLLVLASVVALLGAGCGSDGDRRDSGDQPQTAAGDTAPPVKLTGTTNNHGIKDLSAGGGDAAVELDDVYFAPTFLKAKPGQTLTLSLKNEGAVAHTLTTAAGVDEQLTPNEERTVALTAPASGVLVFYCRFHQAQGMQGAVYLNEGDAGAS